MAGLSRQAFLEASAQGLGGVRSTVQGGMLEHRVEGKLIFESGLR